MGKATTICLYQGEIISVDQALQIRETHKHSHDLHRVFLCTECREPVRAINRRHDGVVSAHIQHIRINPNCSLSPKSKGLRDDQSIATTDSQKIKDSVTVELALEEVLNMSAYIEGSVTSIYVNAYERNREARAACLRHYGCTCMVCRFDFLKAYGEFARGFIHVHHLIPLHDIKSAYSVDPIKDLVPVCPTCHAAIHLGGTTRSLEQITQLLKNK